jgi:predicted ATPase/DNA-binding XRE family transcriptional regulator/tetratricopeptide (TPR) repeat protein
MAIIVHTFTHTPHIQKPIQQSLGYRLTVYLRSAHGWNRRQMSTEALPFNNWIKQRRRALDLTQEDLAERVGCSTITIQKIELGERRPSKQVALRLAECLGTPVEEQLDFVRFARGEAGDKVPSSDEVKRPAPAKTEHPHPNNLPAPLTALLGRAPLVASACDYLRPDNVRLLTFTGAPGIGKTRMALQVAADLLPDFRDGVFFVELAPFTDPTLVASAISATFGLSESSNGSLQEDLKRFLNVKKLLLVLDNFEQVLDAAPLVLDLLTACPTLKVLATSREALNVPGEQQFPISPLDLPDEAHMPDIGALPRFAGIALFLERARGADPTFSLDKENAREVAAICNRLEGLPLAIELAAARVTLIPTGDMLARLDKQLQFLASPARHRHFVHLPARQQTMRAAIEWSYKLLDIEEQQLLSQLGVFVGGFTLEAAEAVCGSGAVDGVGSLLAKSLMKRAIGKYDEAERRFTMLESIREYAIEELEERGKAEELRRRHAIYFLELAERAEPHLTGEDQIMWFHRLERERSNLAAAVSWSLARDEADIALRFGGALTRFWYDRYWQEARWWLEGVLNGALKKSAGKPSRIRARALFAAALVLRKSRSYQQARAMMEECAATFRALGDRLNLGNALRWLATIILEIDPVGERELARVLFDESLEHFEAIGYRRGMGLVLGSLGGQARMEGDYPRAIDLFERAIAINREAKDKRGIAANTGNLGFAHYHRGDFKRMKTLLSESLLIDQETTSAFEASWILVGLAGVALAEGDRHKAVTILGAASALAVSAGTLYDLEDQRDREEIEAAIRREVSEEEWQSAQERGRRMSLDEAVEYAVASGRNKTRGTRSPM